MAKKLVIALSLMIIVACQQPTEQAPSAAPVRDTIAIRYVAVPSLEVHRSADEASEILSKYTIGEAVSVYEMKGDWAEIAVGLDDTGWVQVSALAESRDAVTSSASEPRFHEPPMPVVGPTGVTGVIVLEASVNTNGEVTDIRTLRNTTGSKALEEENIRALQKARFFPLVRSGQIEPFVYEHRVTY